MGNDIIYLDNAATVWPKPEHVYDFTMKFYRETGVNPGRSGFGLALEAGTLLDKLRARLTRFFGGDEDCPERLCFGYNGTDALNLIIFGMLRAGDHVISTNLEHNAVLRPINHLVRDDGVEATFVPFNADGFVDPDDIRRIIQPNTKLVVMNHGSNVIGTVQPIAEVGKICHEHGILLAIDTAQTAGVIPINMKEMNVDAIAFTGHKALMGMTGIGGLCVRKHVELRQTRAGGTGIRSAEPYHSQEYPWRMEFGTPNMVGVASLWAGQDWLDENGVEQTHAKEMALAQRLVEGLREIKGVTVYCCGSFKSHLSTILINIDGLEAGQVGTILDTDHKVATRTGLHCAPLVHQQLGTAGIRGGVRFSIGAFNTAHHVDSAVEAIRQIAKKPQRQVPICSQSVECCG